MDESGSFGIYLGSSSEPACVTDSLLLVAAVVCAPLVAFAGPTFKGGQITWRSMSEFTIEFSIQNAWRRDAYSSANGRCVNPVTMTPVACSGADGFPEVGDVIVEAEGGTTFDPGDASGPIGSPFGPLLFLITSVDYSNNLAYGSALDPDLLPSIELVTHTYGAGGVYEAFIDSSDRMAGVEGSSTHINNGNGAFSTDRFHWARRVIGYGPRKRSRPPSRVPTHRSSAASSVQAPSRTARTTTSSTRSPPAASSPLPWPSR